ncbi:hypothetical protein [Cellulomonas sp. ATA003]|uniref:hypothetical protein n=1 Tax=Cellulomonas sp. ATA003 TaxID=3073064 RepID=UPI0028731600|nr:hypothetical protein [Cellulomonas sp. ATA003]WNB86332.1 hypothetical protein REH70_03505 [Cellulomonas sp. ATA003]
MFAVTLPVLVVAHVAGFYWALRRYSEGATGDLVTDAPDWQSPVGFLTGAAAYAVLWLVLALVCRRDGRAQVREQPAAPRPVLDRSS